MLALFFGKIRYPPSIPCPVFIRSDPMPTTPCHYSPCPNRDLILAISISRNHVLILPGGVDMLRRFSSRAASILDRPDARISNARSRRFVAFLEICPRRFATTTLFYQTNSDGATTNRLRSLRRRLCHWRVVLQGPTRNRLREEERLEDNE